jgi:NTE family protein
MAVARRCRSTIFFLILFLSGLVWANSVLSPAGVLNNSNDLLAADLPIKYGDAAFRERILERTKGEREPIGLVLSGGSARAFAHIGVLRYLEELGIVPDYIISNSMGSIVGLLYAAGLSPTQILTVFTSVDIGELFDLTLPLQGGLLDTSRFAAFIAAFIGDDLRLENLPIPIMMVGEDLATKRQIQIMEGDFISVLEASFVLPIYFSPVIYNGHLLVDGGITNLVPLEIAYDYSDSVIVSTTFYEGKDTNLRNGLVILNTSIDIAKRRQGVIELLKYPQSIWIRCDVEGFSFMDFQAIREISRRGYESAKMLEKQLAALDARGPCAQMATIRKRFTLQEENVLHNYRLFNQLDQKRPSQHLFFDGRSFEYFDDPYYLRNETLFGLSYDARWRTLSLSVDGGLAWETNTTKDLYPSATASLTLNMFPFLLLNGDLSLSWDQGMLPTWYTRLGMEAKQVYLEDQLTVRILGSLENQLSSSFSLQGMLLSVGGYAGWSNLQGFPFKASFEGGWQLSGNFDRNFMYAKARTSYNIPFEIELKFGIDTRFALDGGGNVPYYSTDNFRTDLPAITQQGSLSNTSSNAANHFISSSISAFWKPAEFKPTLGELIIIEDSGLGIFSQFLWYLPQQYFPVLSLGVEVSTKISLLGLKSTPLRAFVGYDMPSNGVFWGIILGN